LRTRRLLSAIDPCPYLNGRYEKRRPDEVAEILTDTAEHASDTRGIGHDSHTVVGSAI